LELLLLPVEALAHRRERHTVGSVLGGVPAGANSELDPAALIASTGATLIASTPGNRNVVDVTIVPSRIRLVSRASAARVSHASVRPVPGSPSPVRCR